MTAASPDTSNAENAAPATHNPLGPDHGFWRFAPAFIRAGEWPGRPPDAAPGVEPPGGTQAPAWAPAAASAPDDAAPPGAAQAAEHAPAFVPSPVTLRLKRGAELLF